MTEKPMHMPSTGRVVGVIALGAFLVVLFASSKEGSGPLSRSETRGRSVYTENCYECHEEPQQGLKKIPPRLEHIFSERHLPDGVTPATDECVRQVIIRGKRTMPAFDGRLTNEQIDDIIAYLHRK